MAGWWQKVLLRARWNCIFCLLLLLKSWSLRGASHHPVSMVLMLIKGTRSAGESNISFGYPRGFESFPSNLSRGRWCNLVCVECLKIKPMVVGFCSTGCWCYSGWWVWDLGKFRRIKCLQRCWKILSIGLCICERCISSSYDYNIPFRRIPVRFLWVAIFLIPVLWNWCSEAVGT